MRALTRTLVSVATAAGIAAGTLATAGTGFAANATAVKPTGSTESVAPWADNLGLSTGQAKKVQQWLKENWGYNGPIDGQLRHTSWSAIQRFLEKHWGHTGPIDGNIRGGTVTALQRWLKNWGYTDAVDGMIGEKLKAAFRRFADSL
ncbi:peptidoglycan-binding domain-containing protein [Streptomyces triculaminicus]|uniref:peptidoglycan-binding domain-containing protein n=1 Tax=Streptomyces triculaminicus TaxID=2816232 RepID=UPI0034022BE4